MIERKDEPEDMPEERNPLKDQLQTIFILFVVIPFLSFVVSFPLFGVLGLWILVSNGLPALINFLVNGGTNEDDLL